jgi:predicted nucleotidyltransferase
MSSGAIRMTTHAPLRRHDILQALRDNRPLLDRFGVARLSLFGSFARDDGHADSDVDLLVEFNRPIGLFEFVRLQRQLGDLVGHRVDLVTPAALKPQLRDRILHEAVVAA